MKIAVFSDFFLPAVDGIVTSLEQLVLEFERQGHQVLIIVPNSKNAPKKIGKHIQLFYLPSIPVFLHPTWQFGLISSKIMRIFKEFSPDVVQIATPANVGMMGIFLAKQQHVPVVGVFHTYFMKPEYLQRVGIKLGTRIIESIGWKFIQFVFRPCEVIISPSESVKKDLEAHNISGKLVVCNNGLHVDDSGFRKANFERILNKHKIIPSKTFLYLGRLSKEKNLKMLIKVFYMFQLKSPDSKLLVVGNGQPKRELEQLALLYDISDKVIFLGEMKHQDLFKNGIFKMARAFVTCSTAEVQPMSIIEALCYGMPVIGIHSQGMVDLIQNGVNGYLVKPGALNNFVSKMQLIMNDDELYKKLSLGSTHKAKEFTVEGAAKAYLNVFKGLL